MQQEFTVVFKQKSHGKGGAQKKEVPILAKNQRAAQEEARRLVGTRAYHGWSVQGVTQTT